ncbi:ABC transporter ATP-binding protein [Anaerocolumna xylanovorans]|uniref:Putative ABC transport system ATP-binding protein n=1 Tax=Anaerocolumna xylanovorans DSM 12503 TaxID=1121345 RepID=A0A1M7Y262_9FIRM|nr:ABC transporter ATP-binding protein [Anaerocolumna xylanovorans]SHO45958.1 putative ABC transport system ATP-binding protein [Anaerocolumna xylanovorans DSM 12503]
MLELKDITKYYKHSVNTFPAVDHANLLVKKQDFIAVTGPSGSGKSTLFHIMTGLLRPSEGSIFLDGTPSFLTRQISFIMQGQNLLTNFTIEDNLYFPLYLAGIKGNYRLRAKEVLELVGLTNTIASYPDRLSGGELRRISIARALMNNPGIIIADEPTSNLDTDNAIKVMELFKTINEEGTAIVISTHDERFLPYSKSIYRMDRGKLSLL